MSHPIRLAAATLVCLPLLALATPAQAGPPPTSPTSPPATSTAVPRSVGASSKTVRIDFSTGENRALKHVQAVIKIADANKRIDYRKVKSIFGKDKNDRYAFATGWWSRRKDWDQFTHISKADKSAIVNWSKKHHGPNPRLSSVTRMHAFSPKPCTGISKAWFNNRDWLAVQAWNSCDTETVKAAMDYCVPAAGAIAAIAVFIAKAGTVAVGNALIGLGCGGLRVYVGWAQQRSTLDAVVLSVLPRDGGRGSFSPFTYVNARPQ